MWEKCVFVHHFKFIDVNVISVEWGKTGGVLLLGYEMYRLLASRRVTAQRKRRKKDSNDMIVIDLDEEDRNKELASSTSLTYIIIKWHEYVFV